MTDFIYSFRIAASGLMFIAFNAGKIPAVIPTNAANISAAIDSQAGAGSRSGNLSADAAANLGADGFAIDSTHRV